MSSLLSGKSFTVVIYGEVPPQALANLDHWKAVVAAGVSINAPLLPNIKGMSVEIVDVPPVELTRGART